MFGARNRFEPDGEYNGTPYQVVTGGKIDVQVGRRIERFKSFEAMMAALSERENAPPIIVRQTPAVEATTPTYEASSPETAQKLLKEKKKGNGCGCLFVVLILAVVGFFVFGSNSDGQKIADIINQQFGNVCEAKVEGTFSIRSGSIGPPQRPNCMSSRLWRRSERPRKPCIPRESATLNSRTMPAVTM